MYGYKSLTADKCQMSAGYELECNVQVQSSDKKDEWGGWSWR